MAGHPIGSAAGPGQGPSSCTRVSAGVKPGGPCSGVQPSGGRGITVKNA